MIHWCPSQASLSRSKTAGLAESSVELELVDQARQLQDLVVAVRPREQRQVVDDRLGR